LTATADPTPPTPDADSTEDDAVALPFAADPDGMAYGIPIVRLERQVDDPWGTVA
jgi:hypothetical protein